MKTNLKLTLALILIIVVNTFAQQQNIIIGTGTNTQRNNPVRFTYGYNWSANIYTMSEIGGACIINSISYNVATSASGTYSNQKIYMTEVQDSTHSNPYYIPPSSVNATLVYDGSFSCSTTGWTTINLQQSYNYQGTGHLMILFENRSGVLGNTYYPLFYSTYKNSSTKARGNLNLSMFDPTKAGAINNVRANVKLGVNYIPNNLGITGWVYPDSTSSLYSSTPVIVRIKNVGTVAQSNFSVKYSIDNGQNWTTETYSGSLSPGNEITYSFSNTANMSASGIYKMIAVVSNPGDTINNNDTIRQTIMNCGNGLSGSYTIGGINGDFNNINDAINALQTCGVSGPVIFNINSGTYSGNYTIDNTITGLSASNTVTFKSSTNNPDDVVLEYNTPSLGNKYLFELYQTDYISFRNITFKTTATNSYANELMHINNCDYINFTYCKFIGTTSNSNSSGILLNMNYSDNISIDSNYFKNGYSSLYVTSSSSDKSSNINISHNIFEAGNEFSIYITNFDSTNIYNNKFTNRINPNTGNQLTYGIYSRYSSGPFSFFNNTFTDTSSINRFRGIVIKDCNPSGSSGIRNKVYNNIFNSYTYSSSYDHVSLNLINVSFLDLYFNTIKHNSTITTWSRGIYLSNSNNINIKNNNIKLNQGYPIYLDGNYNSSNIDYNNLYASNYVAYVNGNTYSSISSYNSSTNHGSNSISVNPNFLSNSNLHIFDNNLNATGTPISGITTDIDGDTRDANNPDVGADEFDYYARDVEVVEITQPTDTFYYGNNDVKIKIKNWGLNTLTSVTLYWEINGNIQSTYSWSGSLTTNSLSSEVSLGSFNFPLGNHAIKVWSSNPNGNSDLNLSNDTLYKNVYAKSAPAIFVNHQTIFDTIKFCNGTSSKDFYIKNTGGDFLNYSINQLNNSWISLNGNTSSTLNPSDSNNIVVNFNSNGISSGTYIENITINSNDPNNATTIVTCSLTVLNQMQNPVDLGADLVSCGDTIIDGGSGYSTYLWNTSAGSQSINVSSSGIYILTVSNGNCSSSDTISVTINPYPTVNFTGLPSSACDNDTIVNLSGSPAGGSFTGSGITNDKFDPQSANLGLNQVIYSYTNTNGCTSSDTQTVEIWSSPIVDAGSDTTVTIGTQANLNSNVSGGSSVYSYQWQPDTLVSSSGSASSNTVNMLNSTEFTLNVNDLGYGCQSSDKVMVYVSGGPLSLNVTSSSNNICFGDSVQLSAIPAGGSGSYTYSWISNPQGFTSNIQSPVINPNITRTYICTVDDGSGTTNASVTITVNPVPSVNINMADTVFCSSESPVQLNATPAGGVFTGGGITANTFNPSAAPIGNSTIKYTYTTSQGCVAEDYQNIKVKMAPVAYAGSDTNMNCQNNGLQLGQSSYPNVLYIWAPAYKLSNAFISNPYATPKMSVNYVLTAIDTTNMCSNSDTVSINIQGGPSVQISNDTIICHGDAVNLTAGGGNSYLWSNGATTNSINVSPVQDTSYSVIVTLNGCDATDTVNIDVNNPKPQLIPDTTVCGGDTIMIDAGIWYGYNWSTGETSQVIYLDSNGIGYNTEEVWVTIEDQTGCTGSDTVLVTFDNCVGMENINDINSLKVYPNPTITKLNIEFKEILNSSTSLYIYNLQGQIVIQKHLEKNKLFYQIDLSSLTDGVYYFYFITGNQYLTTKKIIKN